MCGICGIFERRGQAPDVSALRAMNNTLLHRGPDGEGVYLGGHVGLAMRRLSIIDLAGSDQPLYNEDQQIALIFNGEIYNYRALRSELAGRGHQFRTGGDGETIVHLYEEFGVDAPRHLRGQFAFALWDAREQRLVLARDITGEKPLYYALTDERLLWGSEIKALLAHPLMPRRHRLHEPEALAYYLTHGCFPDHLTAYQGVQSVPPAHTLIVTPHETKLQRYWQLPLNAPAERHARVEHYLPQVKAALEHAVEQTMIADVPLGAFLSGGVDSSLIVALMQRRSRQPVHTFSIGFAGDDSFDETPYARRVAALLGTRHTEFTVRPDMLDVLPTLVKHHDQPFADASALPMYFLSKLTRDHVTVALTGDGGDELFAGYERFYALALLKRLQGMAKGIGQLSTLLEWLPEGTSYRDPVKRAKRFANSAHQPLHHAYLDYVRIFTREQVKSITGVNDADPETIHQPADALVYNFHTYLPHDLLVKTDRMSMAASLEARSPFLHQEVIEAAFAVPFNLRLRGKTTKYLLKQLAKDYLPADIVDRPKHGFGVPLGAWLRRDSRLVRDLLLGSGARLADVMDPLWALRLIEEHERGQVDQSRRLWALMTLEVWLRMEAV
ncbi:asparagine synthase (glutamine-hydrolyzing) [Aggregatilineales bacterium SYSU G02658]